MRVFRVVTGIMLAVVLFASPVNAGGSDPGEKPSLPVSVVIQPVGTVPPGGYYRPGDIAAFEVKITSFARAKELRIKISLVGGAELVQGDMEWSGAVDRGAVRTLNLSVKVPASGKGRIRAMATLVRENAQPVKNTIEYEIQTEQRKDKTKQRPVKDDKGRHIIEY